MFISSCLLAVFAKMSKALALKTSYDLYRTLLENGWFVKQGFDEDAYFDRPFRVVEVFGI